ncbi:MAG TPA: hypothetical protein VMZ28_29385 [Kofleriaceae bacterium]|nr:hypothetical protein [Kofleriaceae bacterium]
MRAVLLQLALLALVGCKVDVDFENTRFQCTDGACPKGYDCIDAVCVVQEGGGGGDGGVVTDGGGGVDGSGELQACDDQFGAAPSYELCGEAADSCEFFYGTIDQTQITCEEVCPMYGATCVESYDATAGDAQCTRDTAEEGCTVPHSSQLCVCSRSPI